MEEQNKNILGNIYGSRVSNSGKWLNLIISTNIDGKDYKIVVPVRMQEFAKEGKPYAHVVTSKKAELLDLPVYEERKPAQTSEEDGEMPF